jgi:hypothetical protein
MFLQLHEKPQQFMTYGYCLGYSGGTADLPLALQKIFKFPFATTYIVTKARLVATIRAATRPVVDLQLGAEASKRQCIRTLGVAGEHAEDTGEKLKGTSSIVFMDLENDRRCTRTKTDLALREKESNFCYRAMDVERQEFGITGGCTIQPEAYRSMLCEQGDTQTEERHKAFAACGFISRVHRLPLFRSKDKLMIGSVLLEGVGEETLTLEDFVTGEKIANRPAVCPTSNSGMVGALKNMQMVLQIVFSDAFENCLEAFIDNLEGVYRPMELVSADFLKHMVEITIRRFFRVVRSVKTSSNSAVIGTPQKCGDFWRRVWIK